MGGGKYGAGVCSVHVERGPERRLEYRRELEPLGGANGASTSVSITNLTATTVTLDTSPAVGDLTLGSADSLNFNPGTQLSVYGPALSNAGQILVNGGAAPTPTFMCPPVSPSRAAAR